jgi:hypothetical protein
VGRLATQRLGLGVGAVVGAVVVLVVLAVFVYPISSARADDDHVFKWIALKP